MPFNPSGVYTLPNGYAGVDGQPILTSQHNPPLEDIQAALSLTLLRDGRAPMVDDLNLNNFKINGLANGTASTDAVAKGQMDAAITAGLATLFSYPNANSVVFNLQDVMIQFGSTVTTTGGGGTGLVVFPVAFTSTPGSVIVCNGDANAYTGSITVFAGWNSAQFGFSTTPTAPSQSVRINWVAIGART